MNERVKINRWRGISLFELVSVAIVVDGLVIAWMFGLF